MQTDTVTLDQLAQELELSDALAVLSAMQLYNQALPVPKERMSARWLATAKKDGIKLRNMKPQQWLSGFRIFVNNGFVDKERGLLTDTFTQALQDREAIDVTANIQPETRRETLKQLADSIPDRNPLIRFEVSPSNKIKLVPSLNEENDYDIIESLRSELLAIAGPIAVLNKRYATSPNLPQSHLFRRLTESYHKELSKEPRDINYAVLYARGARFYAARRTAAQQVSSGEWPELGVEEADAVDAICDLHGPLIMASSVGSKMVSDAHEYETTPDVYRNEQEIVEELGQVISAETEIFDVETVEDIQALTPPIENDPQPARTRRTGILVAGSVLTVVVGGAAWLAGGSTALYFAVPASAGYWGQKYAWEVLKKTEAFKDSSDDDAKRADTLIKQAEEQIGPRQIRLMERMSKLIERQRPLFQKIASMRPEFGWARKFIEGSEYEIAAPPETEESILREASDEDWKYSVSIDNLPNQIVVDAVNATKGSDVFQVYGRRSVNGPGHTAEDDDRLFYEILEGGKGFSINPINGKIILSSPTPTGGNHSMTIRVIDEQSPPNIALGTLQVRIQR